MTTNPRLQQSMAEHDRVDDSEHVYRRIHPKFYNAALACPVLHEAFRPNRRDDLGLSVLRARFALPEDLLKEVDPAHVNEYAIARLAVSDLRKLGLTVFPDPLPDGPPGHAVIPDLSWLAYQADKPRLRPVLSEIATIANADIVRKPIANP